MRLSILIPVFNAEKHIQRCIDSLLGQGIPEHEYEILIRDDGSTDRSMDIIRSYSKKVNNIKFFEDSNKGAYAQRNLLMNEARGEFIYFMDADDYLVRNSLIFLLDYAIKNDTDLTCFDMCLATWEDPEAPVLDKPLNKYSPAVTSGKEFVENHKEMRFEIWWFLIKRSFLEETGIIFEESRYHNDVMFTLNLFMQAQSVVFFPVIIYYYYQSQGSIMRKKGKEHAEKLIFAGKKLINELNELISKIKFEDTASKKLIKNLLYNRDKYAFYLILRLVKMDYEHKAVNQVLAYLKDLGIYPMKYYSGEDMSRKKFLVLYTLFNNKILLHSFIFLKKRIN